MQYGDVVVLVRKSHPDGKITRVNALVVASYVQPEGAEKLSPAAAGAAHALKGPAGKVLAGGEYCDVAYLAPLTKGQTSPSSRNLETLFRQESRVREFSDEAFVGWEPADKESQEAFKGVLQNNSLLRQRIQELTDQSDQSTQNVAGLAGSNVTPITTAAPATSDESAQAQQSSSEPE